jgi:large subunit ribosomal protein L32
LPWPFLLPRQRTLTLDCTTHIAEEITVGAVPKKRVSRARQGNRRQHHKLKIPQLTICPQCRQVRQAHHACPNCGTYRGRQVLTIKDKRSAE